MPPILPYLVVKVLLFKLDKPFGGILMSISRYLSMPSIFAALLLFVFSGVAQTATQLPKGITKVTTVEGITEYKLDNGLRVLLFPDQTKQTITVNVTYMVGSRHENYGETGMAHLLDTWCSKGLRGIRTFRRN